MPSSLDNENSEGSAESPEYSSSSSEDETMKPEHLMSASSMEKMWTGMEKQLESYSGVLWRQGAASSKGNDAFLNALQKESLEDTEQLKTMLSEKKRMFLTSIQELSVKYHGQKRRLRGLMQKENRKIELYFSNLLVERRNRISAKILEKARKMNIVIEGNIHALQAHLDKPQVIKETDKIAFFVGVIMICIVEAIVLKYPWFMADFYQYTVIPLMLFRYFQYHSSKQHYYLLDFCYFCQACLIYFLRYDSDNRLLFSALFAMSNGPLMWAIILWNNSIVFHSIDKVTSTYIHVLPSLVTYCIRWNPHIGQREALFKADLTAWEFWSYPVVLYLCWQSVYLVKTEWIDREKLQSDDSLGTSFRYLSKSYKNTVFYKLANTFGPRFLLPMFVFLQFVYTLCTYAPCYWLYSSQALHSGFIIIIFGASVWNGAHYYVYKFAKHQNMALTTGRKKTSEEGWFNSFIRRGSQGNKGRENIVYKNDNKSN